MKLTKAERAQLREKYGGRCAYCGEPLGDRWHADHIENVERKMVHVPGKGFVCGGEVHRPERDTIANLNPACAPCNIDKHSMTLEDWRSQMQRSTEVLLRDVSTFRRAVRYQLVTINTKPIIFYFESLDRAAAQQEPPRSVERKPINCWCEACDLAQGNPLGRTRMSLCPECGDKRCPRAKHHDAPCNGIRE